MARTVFCVKLKQELPGMQYRPFMDDLGKRIYEQVSADGWRTWIEHSKMLVNEERMDLSSPAVQKRLHDQCEQFFFGEGAAAPPAEYKPQ